MIMSLNNDDMGLMSKTAIYHIRVKTLIFNYHFKALYRENS